MSVHSHASCIASYSGEDITDGMLCASASGKDTCQVGVLKVVERYDWSLDSKGRSLSRVWLTKMLKGESTDVNPSDWMNDVTPMDESHPIRRQ